MRGLIVAIGLYGMIVCGIGHVIGLAVYRVKHGRHIDLQNLRELGLQGEKIASFLRWNTRAAWLFGLVLIGSVWLGRMS